MAYAESTSVPVDRSRAEIERLLTKYGATDFGYIQRGDGAHLMFRANDRNVMFRVGYPKAGERRPRNSRTSAEVLREREIRRRWRALGLVIKAKLESVASGIEVFEDAFLAQIVLPGGKTVGDEVRGNIATAYEQNGGVRLLPAWSGETTS